MQATGNRQHIPISASIKTRWLIMEDETQKSIKLTRHGVKLVEQERNVRKGGKGSRR